MITIRRPQMDALGRDYRARLVDSFVVHLRRHFEDQLSNLDDFLLRREVVSQIAKANSFGLESPRDLVRFLNLGAALGWDFDTDPETAWIGSKLRNEALGSPSERMEIAVDCCLEYLYEGWRPHYELSED